ncbi:hypothetical protein HYX06_00125 [Candidatus Woesearchaeota archaeon]|nr:hypothetical protein [Candidatus Woesearchaeota archaeon]
MKKPDKDKILIDLWKEYLIIYEKNITIGFIQRGLFLGAAIGFLFSIGVLTKDIFLNYWALIIGFFIYALHLNNINNRHFKDVFRDFLKHVETNKVNKFKITKLSWFENNIYYKRKY